MSETKNDERGASGEAVANNPAREAFRAAYRAQGLTVTNFLVEVTK